MVKKQLKRTVTLEKKTETEIEYSGVSDQYGMTQDTEESYSIKCELQVITLERLQFMRPGILRVGDAMAYFLDYYTIQDETVRVETNDLIVDGDISYRVIRIIDHHDGRATVYRDAFLRRLDGGGF